MTESPNKVPWFLVLAIGVAAVATFEQVSMTKARREEAKAKAQAQAQTLKPLPPPAPELATVSPARGAAFEPKTPIDHQWSALPGVTEYRLDFAVPQPDGGCAFDAPRTVKEPHATLSHDDAAPCLVWRVRGGDQIAGSTYTLGPEPGCTLPPDAMVRCLESTATR
jgi:hypothetical protein